LILPKTSAKQQQALDEIKQARLSIKGIALKIEEYEFAVQAISWDHNDDVMGLFLIHCTDRIKDDRLITLERKDGLDIQVSIDRSFLLKCGEIAIKWHREDTTWDHLQGFDSVPTIRRRIASAIRCIDTYQPLKD
jgi:hypothetical protein